MEHNEVFGVTGTDRKGRITCWNRGAELITQFRKEEALNKEICLFFTQTDRERKVHEQELAQALKEGKAEDERWHLRKDGTLFWATGAISPIRDDAGKLVGFCKVFRDDTVKKRTEEQMRLANVELNRFAYTAAHDLQQPIRTIVSYIQLAMRGSGLPADHPCRGLLQVALEGAMRMRTLTGDLLAFAQSGSIHDIKEIVDCNAAFDMAVENLKFAIEETGALVHRGALPEVIGVPSQLGQIFQNLIGNSIKHRHPDRSPRIFVEAQKLEKDWQFSVTDNGIGIDKQDRERIFEAFERAHVDHASPGSGLGLAIVKRVLDAHGGKIWVESELGGGTVFFFTVPIHDPSPH